jgi:hypothetical protein
MLRAVPPAGALRCRVCRDGSVHSRLMEAADDGPYQASRRGPEACAEHLRPLAASSAQEESSIAYTRPRAGTFLSRLQRRRDREKTRDRPGKAQTHEA